METIAMIKPDEETHISKDESFLAKYCQNHHCATEDFAVRVMWQCMHRFRKPLARLIWYFDPEFFLSDLELIQQLRDATTYAKVRETVRFISKQPSPSNIWRRGLKVRVSRSKLLKLAAAELGEAPDIANDESAD